MINIALIKKFYFVLMNIDLKIQTKELTVLCTDPLFKNNLMHFAFIVTGWISSKD